MARSGSITRKVERWTDIYISWQASQSISGNYSDVTANLILKRDASMYANISGSITLDGKTESNSKYISTSSGASYTIVSVSKRIYHNSDGSKSFSLSGYVDFRGTNLSGTVLYKENLGPKTFELTRIDRLASASLSNFTIGSPINLTVTNPSATTYLIAKLYIAGRYIANFAGGMKESGTYTLNLSSSQISNAYKATAYTDIASAEVKIFNYKNPERTEWIGTTSVTAKAYISASIQPSLGDLSISEANSKNNSIYLIQDVSRLKLDVSSVSPSEGAIIPSSNSYTQGVSWIIKKDGKEIWKGVGKSITSPTLNVSGEINVGCNFYDSRKRRYFKSKNIILRPYTKPSVSNMVIERANMYGQANVTGIYISLEGKLQGSTVNGTNKINLKVLTKPIKSTTFEQKDTRMIDNLNVGENYRLSFVMGTYALSAEYHVKIEIYDNFYRSEWISVINNGRVLFAFSKTSIGIGGFPKQEESAPLQVFDDLAVTSKIKPIGGTRPIRAVLQNGWTGDLYYIKDGFGNAKLWGKIRPGSISKWTTISKLGWDYGLTGVPRTVIPIYKSSSATSRSGLNFAISEGGSLYIVDTTDLSSSDEIEINYSYHANGGW